MDFMDILDADIDRENGDNREYPARRNPLIELNDQQFRLRFRLTKESFLHVAQLIENDLGRTTDRSHSLAGEQLLAIFLDVVASNNFQLKSGDDVGVTQATVSRTIAQVSDWFSENVDRFLHLPDEDESMRIQNRIYEHYHLPGVVGMIDGSHMRIMSPSTDEPSFVNRKQFHSINVGAIVDDNYHFIWASAKWAGRAHDSKVWTESDLHHRFARGEVTGRLIGDSAYKAENFLIKIVPGSQLTEPERRYNNAICKARVKVEQAFGQLKRQFHILHGELRYTPLRASRIIMACICLRNVANSRGEPDDLNDVEDTYPQPNFDHEVDNQTGKATIRHIIDNFFT